MSSLAVLFSHIVFSAWALRAVMTDIPQIGKHYPVFTFEKNENPENVMVIYVKLDPDGKLLPDPHHTNRPLIGFYWLMNRSKYKPVHPLILMGIRDRLEFLSQTEDRRSFKLKFSDLKELKQDLRSSEIEVKVAGSNDNLQVEATLTLGPSDQSRELKIDKIYSDTHKTFLPPFRKVDSVTISGKAINDGQTVARTYSAR